MPYDGRTRRKPLLAFQTLTVSTVAIAPTVPAGTDYILIRCETANVRWTDDGTTPTASVGTLLQVAETLNYDGNPANLKFIRKDSTDASVTLAYYS